MSRAAFIIFIFLYPGFAFASTAFDQILGIRISQQIAREILGSPPLPSLEEQSQTHFTPRVSYLVTNADNTTDNDKLYSSLFKGRLKGWSAGAAITESSKANLSVYAFGTITRVSGEIEALDFEQKPMGAGLKDMANTGMNLSAGLSYRLWSKKTFPLVIGLLGGPFISYFRSTFRFESSGSSQNVKANYRSTSFVYGPAFGAQAFLDVFKIQLNPYYLKYLDISSPCQTYTTDAPQDQVTPESAKSCSVDNREIYMKGTFYAYGINVGIFGLTFGAYNKVQKDNSLSSITAKNYNVSYTFNF